METKKDRDRQIYLCKICSESDKYKLLYKTDIKIRYFLTDDELEDIDRYDIQGRNGYPDMKLYKISDVKDIFCSKYSIDRNDENAINNKMEELQKKKEERIIEKKEKAKKKKEELSKKRKTKLVQSLKKYGLVLRNDSKLCNGYIDGTITDWTIDQIVNRMCQMKYLYDYCHMDKCYQEAYEAQQDEFNAGYFPDCSVFEQAELIALEKYGNYPAKWPWFMHHNK